MNYQQTYAIKRNFQYLLRECSIRSQIDSMFDRMFSNELLENDEYEILIRMQLAKEKMRTFISLMLDRRGEKYKRSYDVFMESLEEDLERQDVAQKLTETYENAPEAASDNLSLLSDDMRMSVTSLDSGHIMQSNIHSLNSARLRDTASHVIQNATYTYNNYFYSCPTLDRLSNSNIRLRENHNVPLIARKLSLDSAAILADHVDSDLRRLVHSEESLRDQSDLELSMSLARMSDAGLHDVLKDSNSTTFDEEYKIVAVGSRGVGKTSLVSRFSSKSIINISQRNIKLQVWEFGEDVMSSLADAEGLVIVYDVTRMETLLDVIAWFERTNRYTPEYTRFALVGNKSDLPSRIVSAEQGKMMAQHLGIPTFSETSSKLDQNVQTVFTLLAKRIQHQSVKNTGTLTGAGSTSRQSRRSHNGHTLSRSRAKKLRQRCCIM